MCKNVETIEKRIAELDEQIRISGEALEALRLKSQELSEQVEESGAAWELEMLLATTQDELYDESLKKGELEDEKETLIWERKEIEKAMQCLNWSAEVKKRADWTSWSMEEEPSREKSAQEIKRMLTSIENSMMNA